MRRARWILVLAAIATLATLAIFVLHRRQSKGEEAKRLVEHALPQPRETVRFKLDPSSGAPKTPSVLPPPILAPANPSPPSPASASASDPSAASKARLSDMRRKNALKVFGSASSELGRLPEEGPDRR